MLLEEIYKKTGLIRTLVIQMTILKRKIQALSKLAFPELAKSSINRFSHLLWRSDALLEYKFLEKVFLEDFDQKAPIEVPSCTIEFTDSLRSNPKDFLKNHKITTEAYSRSLIKYTDFIKKEKFPISRFLLRQHLPEIKVPNKSKKLKEEIIKLIASAKKSKVPYNNLLYLTLLKLKTLRKVIELRMSR